jgi:hypothetical protein
MPEVLSHFVTLSGPPTAAAIALATSAYAIVNPPLLQRQAFRPASLYSFCQIGLRFPACTGLFRPPRHGFCHALAALHASNPMHCVAGYGSSITWHFFGPDMRLDRKVG